MTNAEKYLKDGVDIYELSREIATEYARESSLDWYKHIEETVVRFFENQVKPTLTEDEKVILTHINTNFYSQIGRYENGEIIFRNINDSYIVTSPYFDFENMFQFIQPRRRI